MIACSPVRMLGLTILLLTTFASGACGSGDGPEGTATSEPATPSDAGAIRNVDPAGVPAVQAFMRQIGGGDLNRAEVTYADLTRDGRDEAIVPISSGGTLGNLGYVVLTLRSGTAASILTVQRDGNSVGGVKLEVEDLKLVKYVGKYGPEDPRCCPSSLIKTTYYWDGSNLQVEREDEVKQPAPKQ